MSGPQVYVASSLGVRTAGPEALTQLVDALRRRGVEAYLIPMRNYRGRRNDPEYDRYNFAVRDRIPASAEAYFVSPEVSPLESRREFRQVPAERTWMGWFSVNNSIDPRARTYRPSEACCPTYPDGYRPTESPTPADWNLGVSASGPFATIREAHRRSGSGVRSLPATAVEAMSMVYARRVIDSGIRFFAQSFYAQGFVREVLGRPARIITDPIRVVDISEGPRRRNVVAYNKAKSWSLITHVQRLLPEVEFRPIEGMSFVEAAQALASATMYLELGHLPGRDRMPREAAHFGTPVVCLARGAGYCWQDVPLPVEYRVPYREGWDVQTAHVVRRVLDDPARASEEQIGYREWVAGEPERYETAVDGWLEEMLG